VPAGLAGWVERQATQAPGRRAVSGLGLVWPQRLPASQRSATGASHTMRRIGFLLGSSSHSPSTPAATVRHPEARKTGLVLAAERARSPLHRAVGQVNCRHDAGLAWRQVRVGASAPRPGWRQNRGGCRSPCRNATFPSSPRRTARTASHPEGEPRGRHRVKQHFALSLSGLGPGASRPRLRARPGSRNGEHSTTSARAAAASPASAPAPPGEPGRSPSSGQLDAGQRCQSSRGKARAGTPGPHPRRLSR
jgi:hypothetical protein